ncbi:MAG TPA: ATP-binding protein [Gaiellaceae bacterium]
MSRLPIRVRLTLAFALAMAVVLVATGVFLYIRLADSLDQAVDEGLTARAAETVPSLEAGDAEPVFAASGADADERFAQLLTPGGLVVERTPTLEGESLLGVDMLARAARGPMRTEIDGAPGVAGRARLLALPVQTPSGQRILVLGASLDDRDETVGGFLTELFIVGPAALVLASLLGYALATAALRPVERMRAEASAISASEPGRRLPLPDSRDEIHRLGETLNAMLDRLEAALERERTFVADAGHELRTPLAVLRAELELALRRPRSQAELERTVRSAAAEAERLALLADDLLVLARADRGRLSVRRAPVSSRALLAHVAERFSARARSDERAIRVDTEPDVELAGDELRLQQALGNLVENALRHGRGTIRLAAAESNGFVELHVVDEGAGFPEEYLPRAFDRFSRADDARAGDGAGLGLTIADVIARAHGGAAHAANLESGGADVWLSLPRGGPTARMAP